MERICEQRHHDGLPGKMTLLIVQNNLSHQTSRGETAHQKLEHLSGMIMDVEGRPFPLLGVEWMNTDCTKEMQAFA